MSGWRVTRTQPAMPVLEGKRRPTSVSAPAPLTASKTSSSVASSYRKIEDAAAAKIARATSTIDCKRSPCARSEPMTALATAARTRSSGMVPGLDVVRDHVQRGLQLERRERRMLGQDQRADAADVRRGEAVAAGADRAAAGPGHVNVDAPGEELHRR